MTYNNLQIINLTHDIPEYALHSGDVGTIVEVYNNGEGYEVEFIDQQAETISVLTLTQVDLKLFESNPTFVWDEPLWSGLTQLKSYLSSNSGTRQFYNQL